MDPGINREFWPVSLTSVICRILKKILNENIVNHLEVKNIFCQEQYGVGGKRSYNAHLHECFEEWTTLLDEGKDIGVVYFDFSKAFDYVPHARLSKNCTDTV